MAFWMLCWAAMNTWLFQGNPDLFDLDRYLTLAREIVWTFRQAHLAPLMHRGDRVFIWRSSGKGRAVAGIVASGWLLDVPRDAPDDPTAVPLWRVVAAP
jgi:hypothetical protein